MPSLRTISNASGCRVISATKLRSILIDSHALERALRDESHVRAIFEMMEDDHKFVAADADGVSERVVDDLEAIEEAGVIGDEMDDQTRFRAHTRLGRVRFDARDTETIERVFDPRRSMQLSECDEKRGEVEAVGEERADLLEKHAERPPR